MNSMLKLKESQIPTSHFSTEPNLQQGIPNRNLAINPQLPLGIYLPIQHDPHQEQIPQLEEKIHSYPQ